MAQPNAERFRAGYQAFLAGDMAALRRDYLTGDVGWHAFGAGPLSGDFHGPGAVIALFGRTVELSGERFACRSTTPWPATATRWSSAR